MDKKKSKLGFIIAALAVALIIGVFLSPLASKSPDGLDKTAIKFGFVDLGENAVWTHPPVPDYTIPFLGETTISGMAAGLIGTLLVFGLGWGVGTILKRKKG